MNASVTADKRTLLLIDHQVGTMQLIENIAMGARNAPSSRRPR